MTKTLNKKPKNQLKDLQIKEQNLEYVLFSIGNELEGDMVSRDLK